MIKEFSNNSEQLYQFERDNLKLKQKLLQFENAQEKNYNLKQNEDNLDEKNLNQNSEGDLKNNIHSEIDNIKSLLNEFENKIVIKQNYLNSIELQLDKIEYNNENPSLCRENEELREELKRLKNSGGSNIFRSNYVEKPLLLKKEHFNSNVEKIDNELQRTNKLVLGFNEPPKRIMKNLRDTKDLELSSCRFKKTESENNNKSSLNENKMERLDTHPSKENKFDNISRKISSLSKQKQNAFNLSKNLFET